MNCCERVFPGAMSAVEWEEEIIYCTAKPLRTFDEICHDAWGVACVNKYKVLFDFNGHHAFIEFDDDIEQFKKDFWDHIQEEIRKQ